METKDNKSSHRKGLIGELEVTLYLIQREWKIFKPIDPNSRVDLLLEKDGNFRKVQVKYCTPHKGCLRIELDKSLRKTKPYSLDEVDDIAVFQSDEKKFYLIPLKDILPRKGMWLRVSQAGNKQKRKINWAQKYLIEK